MQLHIVDATYELFRAYYGAPEATAPDGRAVGATRGFLRSLMSMLRQDEVTHVACAFDHVIESFRNELYAGYKTGDGVPADLMAQFPLAERAAHALGLVVWPMVEFEADDALATAAARWAQEPGVERVVIASPDKDLTQCVRGTQVVCWDRRRDKLLDAAGVLLKFGVPPASIPDWLALVGDDADGYPGIPRWGAKCAATLLAHYGTIENIPDDARCWAVAVRGAAAAAESLSSRRDEALLYRRLATLRTDVPLPEDLDGLCWRGLRKDELRALCTEIGDEELWERAASWAG